MICFSRLGIALLSAVFLLAIGGTARGADRSPALPVKVMIVSMFGPEGKTWTDKLGPTRTIVVPGLSPDYPAVRCNRADVCVMTTGMGHANAAASIMALAFSRRFDLRHTYFLVAGIAGISPDRGTLGSVAWAHYLIDFGLQWEIDAREIPAAWPSGYLGINAANGDTLPVLNYRTEMFALNDTLQHKAFELSRDVVLADGAEAQAYRAKYTAAPANQPPAVIECDTVSSDTWFSGTALAQRADTWTRLLTAGKGQYCTTQQEDNATFEALKRAAAAGLVDTGRVAVLRAGSDFDRPPAGTSDVDNLLLYHGQGGFGPAIENLSRAGMPLVSAIIAHWSLWKEGVPAD